MKRLLNRFFLPLLCVLFVGTLLGAGTLKELRAVSPSSVFWSYEILKRGAGMSLRAALHYPHPASANNERDTAEGPGSASTAPA